MSPSGDDSVLEFEESDLSELDDSQERENLEGEFTFELGEEDKSKEEGTSDIQSELENLDQQFAKRFEVILSELSSGELEEPSDISANFSKQYDELAREIDDEYFSLFKKLKKWGKKLAPLIAPGVPLLSTITKLSPEVRKRIWGGLKGLGKQYLSTAIPGIGIAGPILGKAGVPVLKNIFETAEGEVQSAPLFAENFAKIAHNALEYAYENLEIDSVDPLKARDLANRSIKFALRNLKNMGTTGDISTGNIPKSKVFYISPGESVTITFVGKQ